VEQRVVAVFVNNPVSEAAQAVSHRVTLQFLWVDHVFSL
jgi:hypothetical protein